MFADISTPFRGYCLCVGAAKTGTTWLFEQLRSSNEMHFAPEKEIHYFFSRYGNFNRLPPAERFRKLNAFITRSSLNFSPPQNEIDYARNFASFQRNLDWYQMFAQGPVTQSWYRSLFYGASAHQYACDFSPSTSKISLDGIYAIRKMSPNVKIIYILRNPAERLWSHVKFHAQYLGNFAEVEKYSPGELVSFIKKYSLHEDGLYANYLQRFLSVFDRSDIMVIDYSEIKNNSMDLLTRICSFLEINHLDISNKEHLKFNESPKMDMPAGLFDSFKAEMSMQTDILEDLGYSFVSEWRNQLRIQSR